MHAVAIRLDDEGFGDDVIALALGIEESEVPVLLEIATLKLTNLMTIDTFRAAPSHEYDKEGSRR